MNRIFVGDIRLKYILSAMLFGFGALPIQAAHSDLPTTLDEAIQTERTAFYDTPSLASSKPGDLLRQEQFSGYSTPIGVKTVRILYHSLSVEGHDVATSGVVLIPAGPPPAGG
jgi:hypothetical protein